MEKALARFLSEINDPIAITFYWCLTFNLRLFTIVGGFQYFYRGEL
jgi:hypothetical protein